MNRLQKIGLFVLGLLIGTPLIALAINVTVPAAPGNGYALVSTTTGAYIVTTTDPFHVGSLAVSTTTATSTFLGGVTVGTLNQTGAASSTFANGIILKGGCLFQNGACLSAGGTGTVTSIATTFPILGGTITTTGTLSWGGLSTTSNLVAGHVVYSSGVNTITDIATTTQTFSGPFSLSAVQGTLIGGSNSTISWTGLSTTSQPANSNLLVSNGSAGVYGVATGTISAGSTQITVTAGRAAVGGALAIDCATASASQAGCLGTVDFARFNAKVGTSTADTSGQLTFFTSTNATPATIGGNSALTFSTTGSTLLTVTNASTTNLSVGSYMMNPLTPSPIYVASSTWGGGTTTITLFNNARAMTIVDTVCSTDAGTLNVDIYHAQNHLNFLQASTTHNTIVFGTNNVLSAGTTTKIDIGGAASLPTQFNCTLETAYNGSS